MTLLSGIIKELNGRKNEMKKYYQWPNMIKEITEYIKNCASCQRYKFSKIYKAALTITTTASVSFERCFLDIVGPLPMTEEGNKYILTFQDDLSKFSEAFPIPNQEAKTVARYFVQEIVCRHGISKEILTDQGTNFLSKLFKNVCRLLKIKNIQTSAYRPESNGALERSHRTLAEYLRHFVNEKQTDWDEYTPFAMFTFNTSVHSSTDHMPFELLYGFTPTLPTSITSPPNKQTNNYDDYLLNLQHKLKSSKKLAKDFILKSKKKNKGYYDKGARVLEIKAGDKVLLRNEKVSVGLSRKLSPLWKGLYMVVSRLSSTNVVVRVGKKDTVVHVNRLRNFKKRLN